MNVKVVVVDNLIKQYSGVQAVDGVSFAVEKGEIFGLLGPNGAGKTTTLSILQGLRKADGGQVFLFGLDIQDHARLIKQRIGVQLQRTSLLADLNVLDQVIIFARLYGRRINRAQALSLLEQVGLEDKARAFPAKLSGGQQQRLAFALALVNDPDLIFLDEPTAGMDPQSRRHLWGIVKNLQERGCTIVVTTHSMEEAETVCHRVGIMDRGRILDMDRPDELVRRYVTAPEAGKLPEGPANLETVFLQLTGRDLRDH